MNLETAIKTLNEEIINRRPRRGTLLEDATKLLIEAGKQILANRPSHWTPPELLLPGETKE